MKNIIQPYIWMFKISDFKTKFFQVWFVLSFLIIVYVALFFASDKCVDLSMYIDYLKLFVSILCFTFLLGYFIKLTRNIISRTIDVSANNIYSGSVNVEYKIELPNMNPLVFIKDGVVFILALFLLVLPYTLLYWSTNFSDTFLLPIDNIDLYHRIYAISYNLLYVIFFTFIPVLIWLYIKDASIFAVWNYRKAIYFVGNYFSRYILSFLHIVLVSSLFCFISYNLVKYSIDNFVGFSMIAFQLLLLLVFSFVIIYFISVLAYLLGIIVPVDEI